MTIDALAPHPELRVRLSCAQALGAAYEEDGGPIALYWPPRPGASPELTYRGAEAARSRMPAAGASLLAAFLTVGDVEEIADTFDEEDETEDNRRRRRDAARTVAARRARERAALLRLLRRGDQPPGSVCLAHNPFVYRLHPLIRFPDGRGKWATTSAYISPWRWRPSQTGPAVRVLALDLSEDDCRAAADCADLAQVEAVLLERGLA